jgi:hypothetical protein
MFLTKEQLIELTGYTVKAKQIKALRIMGIRFRIRPADGRPVVHESEFVVKEQTEEVAPDFSWMNRDKEDGQATKIQ